MKRNVAKTRKPAAKKPVARPAVAEPTTYRGYGLDYAPLRASLMHNERQHSSIIVDHSNGRDRIELGLRNTESGNTEAFHIPLEDAREYIRRLTRVVDAAETAGLIVG